MNEKKRVVNPDMKQCGMFLALIAIYVIFAIMTGGKNLSPANINKLIMQNGYVVILAIGMLFCVLTGNVDLGVGSVVALTGAGAGIILVDYKMNMWIAILVALLIGLLAGMFAGFFIAYLDVPPFVVTLATMLMGRGLTYTLLNAQTRSPYPDDYVYLGAGFLPTVKINVGSGTLDLVCIAAAVIVSAALVLYEIRGVRMKEKKYFRTNYLWQAAAKLVIMLFVIWFCFIKLAQYNGLPFVLVIMALLAALYGFITSRTVAGRQIYAMGGNRKAADFSGIDTRRVYFWVYTNMGILSAVAGIVISARNSSSNPKAGDGFEMDAIASCYIGGAAVAGGTGTIMGAVVGAFIMGILNNGMSLYGWSTDVQKIVKGAVLLGAVTVNIISRRRKAW